MSFKSHFAATLKICWAFQTNSIKWLTKLTGNRKRAGQSLISNTYKNFFASKDKLSKQLRCLSAPVSQGIRKDAKQIPSTLKKLSIFRKHQQNKKILTLVSQLVAQIRGSQDKTLGSFLSFILLKASVTCCLRTHPGCQLA